MSATLQAEKFQAFLGGEILQVPVCDDVDSLLATGLLVSCCLLFCTNGKIDVPLEVDTRSDIFNNTI